MNAKSLAWKEASYASADFSTVGGCVDILPGNHSCIAFKTSDWSLWLQSLSILIGKTMAGAGGGQDTYAVLHGASVASVGSYDSCMALASQGYHFCDMRVKDVSVLR